MIKHILHTLLVGLLLSVTISASAKSYSISGSAPGSEGKQLTVLAYEEYFTNTLKVLRTEFITNNGEFQVTIESAENELLVLRIDAVNAQLYLGASSSYEVVMNAAKAKAPLKFSNNNWCGLEFIGLSESDINNRLEQLNGIHSGFYERNSAEIYQVLTNPESGVIERTESNGVKLAVGKNKEGDKVAVKSKGLSSDLISEFTDSLKAHHFDILDNTYENISARYMLAELENLLGRREKEVFQEYLSDAEFNRNQEFVSFNKVFYRNVFESIYQSDRKESFLSYLYDLKLDSALIEVDSILVLAAEPLEFVLLAGIETGFNLPNVSSRDITLILELISREGKAPYNQMARNYRQQLAKGKTSYQPEECVFMNLDEELIQLSEWKGEIVYINFFATWNMESVGHLERIKKLESKFGNRIKFVSVCMDYDWDLFKDFLIDHRNYNWTFLFGNTDKLLKEKLQISTVPHYILLDPTGKFLMNYTPSPEEGIENTLSELLRK
ncbi:MAG: TlpA family protein disulfide reductase [Flavobacteriales bacterium]